MLRTTAALFLLVASTPFVAAQDEGASPVRVMSFNVRYDNPGDGPNAWPHRKDWVAEIIGANADVVGMQEVEKGQLDDLQQRLPDFEFYGAGRDDGKEAGEYVPLAWRKDRFTAADHGVFWHSETPDVPGSKSWDTSLPRITTWARLKDQATGRTFLAVNTHYDHRGEQARRETAKLLRSWIESNRKGDPVLLTGDFNSRPGSVPFQNLTAASEGLNLSDARAAAANPEGPESTSSGFFSEGANERLKGPGRRIDFIFTAGQVDVTAFRTFDESRDGKFPSDHLPIAATVKIGPL